MPDSKITKYIALVVVCSLISGVVASAAPYLPPDTLLPVPPTVKLDSRLPVQTVSRQPDFLNINAKFGSRFDFAVEPGKAQVHSGSAGIFHDNAASYVVGIAPAGQSRSMLFHMGQPGQDDSYLYNERWIQGLDTTRWMGDTTNVAGERGLRVVVDIIDPFLLQSPQADRRKEEVTPTSQPATTSGPVYQEQLKRSSVFTPGEQSCTVITACRSGVKDDTLPVFIVGVTLYNDSASVQSGQFLFGSNRQLPARDACTPSITPGRTAMTTMSYGTAADVAGGTLFLSGDRAHWQCKPSSADRAGLIWLYQIAPGQSRTAYLFLGSWNTNPLFANTKLPAGCQQEKLYATTEWSSLLDMAHFASDNLVLGDNLLGRAQEMEDVLIQNNILTPEQRWLIGQALRSYKASTWLVARPACAGGGYDAAVYEGTYGYLSTIDVLHEYGYFEITRVPWFFKAAFSAIMQNATHNASGLYFQHDQGTDITPDGHCTHLGDGMPTLRSTCYLPPHDYNGAPMPTEENANVALLLAYYVFVTKDHAFLRQYIEQLDAAMQHNIAVGDPRTGIASRAQETKTTYDAARDCLHNNQPGAGNLIYQGVKEAAAYRATAYLDLLLERRQQAATWQQAAQTIESSLVSIARTRGFLPVAENTASNDCSGRTITLGEGLFYLHLIGQDRYMNQDLLHILASQYLADVQATTLQDPSMIAMTSMPASGPQCDGGYCHRYTWFSKVMLSGLVADLVYTRYGCSSCARLDMVSAAYAYNINAPNGFSDGFYENRRAWGGHYYPRGLISWAFLSPDY